MCLPFLMVKYTEPLLRVALKSVANAVRKVAGLRTPMLDERGCDVGLVVVGGQASFALFVGGAEEEARSRGCRAPLAVGMAARPGRREKRRRGWWW